ncbi:type VII secretion-associated serine protease mycosin [Mycobacterium sp. CBMA293]|uniref:type VII secretion-associated serine protease mycosin n=1 Tax=unclassified Mycolicibacterium TaxID=2636767 RepID=UPI0012DE72E3|nr:MULTISPECIES: type VII secretion-associated serine protease mycosin [unclassified Mycolicibacterium]MUL48532.1 type VII secretion-associated serine protease mycosin [Mycolicibacterium sp. CBMA 360]MUL61989.1 type VII secretion-associated serine protease mycosin [Mycolicibacterium sp. CBMA 335]MUL73264.1 type VII secretion-associated serine protease mycosin [Mycolicibacterium sp. CBMA 311]MUL96433.1 type VII secretion-associated serine protease mycosin [Mycolicibacterium sp. CBMA 230]MUM0532
MTSAAPVAYAIAPRPVDHSQLPPPGAPAPPGRTEQSDRCSTPKPAGNHPSSHFAMLNLAAVWPLSRGSGQMVAVVDTGVARHRLLPHLVPGGDYVTSGDGTSDCDGHGTAIAGLIGAAASGGPNAFSGVAPEASIMAIRQSSNKFRLSDDHEISGVGDVDTLARAVRSAADAGATVINISSVACMPATDPLDDRSLGAALAYAVDVRNVVVVSAAGNASGECAQQNPPGDPKRRGTPDWDNVHTVVSPAWYDDYVLTVASVGPTGAPSPFSLAGPWVDVAAPGESVVSLSAQGDGLVDSRADGRPLSGTSYAAPIVSGLVALVRSRQPQLSARQVMARIKDTAHHPAGGWNAQVGYGVIDPLAAVSTDGAPMAAPARVATAQSPTETGPDHRQRRIALLGTAVCIAVAAAALTTCRLNRGSAFCRTRPERAHKTEACR